MGRKKGEGAGSRMDAQASSGPGKKAWTASSTVVGSSILSEQTCRDRGG